ncbi:HalOD1 output domain-containing protein [Halorubrum sp. HHNYT27]|uniref:HalOD1 output domain-containing protein n=1 Tax=Halorubrum sp. HHNYT27 TaxID=3402275 RepID=UPI003EB9BFB7
MNIETNVDGDVPVCKVNLHEDTDRSASHSVVSSIAELTGRDPNDLDPLWDSVDPEALDSFVDHASDRSTPCRIAFEYEGYEVELIGARRLRLTAKREPLSSPMP